MFVWTAFILPFYTQNSSTSRFHLSAISLAAIWADMRGPLKPVTLSFFLPVFDPLAHNWIKLVSPQTRCWPVTPHSTTCRAPLATPTCATPSRSWLWRRTFLSMHSACRFSLSRSLPTSLQPVRLIFTGHAGCSTPLRFSFICIAQYHNRVIWGYVNRSSRSSCSHREKVALRCRITVCHLTRQKLGPKCSHMAVDIGVSSLRHQHYALIWME